MLVLGFLWVGLGGCHRETVSRPDLEARLAAAEKRIAEQEQFITKAKEVLASHRAHILDLENRVPSRVAVSPPVATR
jgi:hypothetical protein